MRMETISANLLKRVICKIKAWKSPNGAATQIDHVLIDRRHVSSIIGVKIACGPNCDHFLVKLNFRERLTYLKSGSQHCRKKWDFEKFKLEDITEQFKESVSNKLTENWGTIEESAAHVIGEKRKQRSKEWFDEESTAVLHVRNEHRLAIFQCSTRPSYTAYNETEKNPKRL